jgi:nitric oxide reductase large subunit
MKLNQFFFTGLISLLSVLLLCQCQTDEPSRHSDASADSNKSFTTATNDKLISVKDVEQEEIKQVVRQFCDLYNKEAKQVFVKLFVVSEREFVMTFPKDIKFNIFCYMVNYLKYPHQVKYDPEILAWATTKKTDHWMRDKIVGKQIMLFIPSDDREFDNVYLTTEDQIGYKIPFSKGKQAGFTEEPKIPFINREQIVSDMKDKPWFTFE